MNKTKILALLLVLTMVMALLAGCGDTAASSAASTAQEPTETVASTPTEEPEAPAAEETTPAEQASVEESPAEEVAAANDFTESNASLNYAPFKEMLKTLTTELPITEEEVTLEYWLGFETSMLSYVEDSDLSNHQIMKYIQEVTGVTLDLIVVDKASESDKFNLMIASGDYSDMFSGGLFSSGIEYAYEEDIIIDLTDYIEENMPNYWTVINSDQAILESVMDNDMFLEIYPVKDQNANPTGQGLFVRMDWLESLNMEVPTTYDEMAEVLRAFKTEYGCEEPLSLYNAIISGGLLIGGFGSTAQLSTNNMGGSALSGYYQVDGEVVFGATADGTRNFLSWLNELYNEELINFENMQNRETNPFSDLNAGLAASGGTGYIMNNQPFGGIYSGQSEDANCNWWPVNDVAETKDTINHFFDETTMRDSNTVVMVISSQCENVETALQFLDYGYSYEGSVLYNFGFQIGSGNEVESWDYNDAGEPEFDAAVIGSYESTNVASTTLCTKDLPGIVFDTRLSFEFGEREQACFAAWSTNKDTAYILGSGTTFNADEGTQASALYSDILTYVATCALQFINGDLDVNDDAVWADYVANIEAMNLDELTAIVQGAYDRANG